jgi:hypothetical protein
MYNLCDGCDGIQNTNICLYNNDPFPFELHMTIRNVTKFGKIFNNALILLPVYKKNLDDGIFELIALLGILRNADLQDQVIPDIDCICIHDGIEGIIEQNKKGHLSKLNIVLTCRTYPY